MSFPEDSDDFPSLSAYLGNEGYSSFQSMPPRTTHSPQSSMFSPSFSPFVSTSSLFSSAQSGSKQRKTDTRVVSSAHSILFGDDDDDDCGNDHRRVDRNGSSSTLHAPPPHTQLTLSGVEGSQPIESFRGTLISNVMRDTNSTLRGPMLKIGMEQHARFPRPSMNANSLDFHSPEQASMNILEASGLNSVTSTEPIISRALEMMGITRQPAPSTHGQHFSQTQGVDGSAPLPSRPGSFSLSSSQPRNPSKAKNSSKTSSSGPVGARSKKNASSAPSNPDSSISLQSRPLFDWETSASKIVEDLLSMTQGRRELFGSPVTVEIAGEQYFQIIKKPMDFSKIIEKLTMRSYTNRQEFAEDIRLICSNCSLFNGKGTVFDIAAMKLLEDFEAAYIPWETKIKEEETSFFDKWERESKQANKKKSKKPINHSESKVLQKNSNTSLSSSSATSSCINSSFQPSSHKFSSSSLEPDMKNTSENSTNKAASPSEPPSLLSTLEIVERAALEASAEYRKHEKHVIQTNPSNPSISMTLSSSSKASKRGKSVSQPRPISEHSIPASQLVLQDAESGMECDRELYPQEKCRIALDLVHLPEDYIVDVVDYLLRDSGKHESGDILEIDMFSLRSETLAKLKALVRESGGNWKAKQSVHEAISSAKIKKKTSSRSKSLLSEASANTQDVQSTDTFDLSQNHGLKLSSVSDSTKITQPTSTTDFVFTDVSLGKERNSTSLLEESPKIRDDMVNQVVPTSTNSSLLDESADHLFSDESDNEEYDVSSISSQSDSSEDSSRSEDSSMSRSMTHDGGSKDEEDSISDSSSVLSQTAASEVSSPSSGFSSVVGKLDFDNLDYAQDS